MANKRIHKRRKKRKQKVTVSTTHVPLCAIGTVLKEKDFFDPIHQTVDIEQKAIEYRPTDKLVFAALGIIAGAETVSEINTVLRPHRPLLLGFGYDKCADQSVIQDTINAATPENVEQLESAMAQIWQQHNRIGLTLLDEPPQQATTIDMDLSPLPTSKRAQKSEKGYVAKNKNQYTRQLARVIAPDTQEIITQQLYSGSTKSMEVFKEMVYQMEQALGLTQKAHRQRIRLRLDAGFGTDENINFALWRGYQILVKVFSWKRVAKCIPSVKAWQKAPSDAGHTEREAGFVTAPHRYGRKTIQVGVRTQTETGQWSYSVLVTTDPEATVTEAVTDYDKRSGVPESTFCQDYQGLRVRKQRKKGAIGQQVLLLLSQLAHNLCVWIKGWLLDALIAFLLSGEAEPEKDTVELITRTIKTIQSRGIKRLLRQTLWLSGQVVFKGKKVVGIGLNPLYPLIDRITTAFSAFLAPYNIRVSLDET